MRLAFAQVELAAREGVRIGRVGQTGLRLRLRDAGKLSQELGASLADQLRQFLLVVGKVEERAGRLEFLPLKQHGRARREQQQGGHRPATARTAELMSAQAPSRVRDLVVILDKVDEAGRVQVETRRAAPFLLPLVALSLVEIPILG